MAETSQKFSTKLRRLFLNKYAIVLVCFGAFFIFFDNNNLISRWQTSRKITQLEKEVEFYKNEINTNKQKMLELQSNSENLEKFAREQYLMKRENEEIFIIKE